MVFAPPPVASGLRSSSEANRSFTAMVELTAKEAGLHASYKGSIVIVLDGP